MDDSQSKQRKCAVVKMNKEIHRPDNQNKTLSEFLVQYGSEKGAFFLSLSFFFFASAPRRFS